MNRNDLVGGTGQRPEQQRIILVARQGTHSRSRHLTIEPGVMVWRQTAPLDFSWLRMKQYPKKRTNKFLGGNDDNRTLPERGFKQSALDAEGAVAKTVISGRRLGLAVPGSL